jgi:hypothetical protein
MIELKPSTTYIASCITKIDYVDGKGLPVTFADVAAKGFFVPPSCAGIIAQLLEALATQTRDNLLKLRA